MVELLYSKYEKLTIERTNHRSNEIVTCVFSSWQRNYANERLTNANSLFQLKNLMLFGVFG